MMGWTLRRISDWIVHAQTRDMHQYYTRIRTRVIACDGAGNTEPKRTNATHRPPPEVEDEIREILTHNTT